MSDCAGLNKHTDAPGQDKPIRVFLRFKADDVPGNPQSRHMTLSKHFYSEDLKRKFNNETDWIHVPANIDERGAKCWMILDLNAVGNDVRVNELPIRVFRVQYSDATPKFNMTPYNDIRRFSDMFEWGNRVRDTIRPN